MSGTSIEIQKAHLSTKRHLKHREDLARPTKTMMTPANSEV